MNACSWTDQYKNDPRGPRIDPKGHPHNAGPDGWKYLHLAALDGNLSQGTASAFASCIGCPDCKRHFQQLLRRHPISSVDREAAFATTVRWHNEVNRKLGAPEMDVSMARRMWDNVKTVPVGLVSPGVPQFSRVAMR